MARPFFLASLILMLAIACAPSRGRSGGGGGGEVGAAGDGAPGWQGAEGVQAGEDAEGAEEGERKVGEGGEDGGGEGEGEGGGAERAGGEGHEGREGGEGHEGNQGEEGGQEGGREGGEDGQDCIDEDGDGYGLGRDCLGRDCDDGNPDVNPEADEICDNGFDDDCDARFDGADDECAQDCVDGDGDRYGQGPGCIGPDCDDFDPLVNPGIREVCGDDIDNDCDGDVDEEEDCGADGDGLRCWQFVQCTGDCEADDRGCRQRCGQAVSEDGADFYTDLVECIEDECPDPEDGQCPFAECGSEYGECLLDNDEPLDCGLLELCYRTCPPEDRACIAGCEDVAEQGARDQLQVVFACIARNCDAEAPDFQECYQERCARELEACFGPPPE